MHKGFADSASSKICLISSMTGAQLWLQQPLVVTLCREGGAALKLRAPTGRIASAALQGQPPRVPGRVWGHVLRCDQVDLTYAVCLNLAIQHQANDNDNEARVGGLREQWAGTNPVGNGAQREQALTIYTQIVKNKQYPLVAWP